MAVNLTSADKALKSYYLDVVVDQLNNKVSPFFAKIKHSTNSVYGKDVKVLASYGINGGIGAGTEDGNLPSAQGNNYEEFTATLKNLYGTIEISDKAIRASENGSGAFVNLLTAEMEGLVKASAFNFSRMLFGDGTGKIATVEDVESGAVVLDTLVNVAEGMVVDFRNALGQVVQGASGRKIVNIDRENSAIYLSGSTLTLTDIPANTIVTVKDSYNNEITGLGKIFDENASTIYGVSKTDRSWLNPYVKKNAGSVSDQMIQEVLDLIEERSGSAPNIIICSWDVRRALLANVFDGKRNIETLELEGGFKALSYNGIPIVTDKFCPAGCMYLLNTDDFILHELCDWEWLADDDGRILKQVAGKPVYSATLVKYAELICNRPAGQGLIKGITA